MVRFRFGRRRHAPTAMILAMLTSAPLPGCALWSHHASNVYVRAQPVDDPPSPAPALPADSSVSPESVHAPPHRSGASTPAASPQQVVAEANRRASQAPDRGWTLNSIVQYAYEPGSLYQVYAAPMRITDIALEPGEKLLGQPAAGDTVRWILAAGHSIQKGLDQVHLYLKPTRADLETNLAITTDRRSYMLELHSYPDTYMASVMWHYPQDELARLQADVAESAAREQSSASVVSLDALNFNYAIEVVKGKPAWTPVQAFDDGRKTFIRFPEAMRVREAPALFVLRNSETQLVNYRVRNNLYVVDRLVDAAELRVGQRDQEIVRVVRTGPARP